MNLQEDGLISVTIGDVEQRLDLYEVHGRLAAIWQAAKPAAECQAETVALIQELGFPAVSYRLADRFAFEITQKILELKKKDGDGNTPASPDSTASTPGA